MKLSQHTHLIFTLKACIKSRCEEEKLIVEDVDANPMGNLAFLRECRLLLLSPKLLQFYAKFEREYGRNECPEYFCVITLEVLHC